ncbi:MAG: hypothetical protein KUG74_09480 [Rhodobacteraceae bacterium]|nr:hypothetical protein [Paracoccaceae bacterium]
MLNGFANGGLEIRRESDGSARLAGRFPYNKRAVLSAVSYTHLTLPTKLEV